MIFHSTMGLEFTYLTRLKAQEAHRVRGYKYLVAADFNEIKLPHWRIDVDEGALEISSPAFKTLPQVKDYFDLMSDILARYPLVTHREDTFSGGGHIHIGLPREYHHDPLTLLLFLMNVYKDVTNRPYLNWIFNEDCNDTSANSYVYLKPDPETPNVKDLIFQEDPQVPLFWSIKDILQAFGSHKGYACRVDSNHMYDGLSLNKLPTLEFRFFDAMRDWDTCRKHLVFANAYFKHLHSISKSNKQIVCRVKSPKDIAAIARRDGGLEAFWDLLSVLKLPRADYEPFIERNYAQRKKRKLLK